MVSLNRDQKHVLDEKVEGILHRNVAINVLHSLG